MKVDQTVVVVTESGSSLRLGNVIHINWRVVVVRHKRFYDCRFGAIESHQQNWFATDCPINRTNMVVVCRITTAQPEPALSIHLRQYDFFSTHTDTAAWLTGCLTGWLAGWLTDSSAAAASSLCASHFPIGGARYRHLIKTYVCSFDFRKSWVFCID